MITLVGKHACMWMCVICILLSLASLEKVERKIGVNSNKNERWFCLQISLSYVYTYIFLDILHCLCALLLPFVGKIMQNVITPVNFHIADKNSPVYSQTEKAKSSFCSSHLIIMTIFNFQDSSVLAEHWSTYFGILFFFFIPVLTGRG